MSGRYVLYFQRSFKFNIFSTTSSNKNYISLQFVNKYNLHSVVSVFKNIYQEKNKLHHVYVFNDAFFMSLTNKSYIAR